MVIGFHYHIPIRIASDGSYYTQSFYGIFIDALSVNCSKLIIFTYTPTVREEGLINYQLTAVNIELINIGPHASLPSRLIKFPKVYSIIKDNVKRIDIFLVRSPTPLVLIFGLLVRHAKIVLYLVGDYEEAAKMLQQWKLKTMMIKLFSKMISAMHNRIAKDNLVISNSQVLLNKYSKIAANVALVKSTTLSSMDIFRRYNSCTQPLIKVLFTGRLDPLKGLYDIVEACKQVAQQGNRIEFHFAGLPVKGLEDFPDTLLQSSSNEERGVKIYYHGLKKVGEELNSLYRSADIYMIASQSDFEGFPRTIWEAMANGLPVIATSVGSIPMFLTHGQNALLVPPRNVRALSNALHELINDDVKRLALIENGYALAESNTLDRQSKLMIDTLRNFKLNRNE